MGAEISGANALWDLFQADAVMPSQFAARFGRQRSREEILMLAVFTDAIEGLEKYRYATTVNGQRLYREDERWLESMDTTWLYSFESICMHFEWDPEAVRAEMRRRARGGR